MDYFVTLISSQVSQCMFEKAYINFLFDFNCSEQARTRFTKKFTAIEIREAIFSLQLNNTSGPENYSAEFSNFVGCGRNKDNRSNTRVFPHQVAYLRSGM